MINWISLNFKFLGEKYCYFKGDKTSLFKEKIVSVRFDSMLL